MFTIKHILFSQFTREFAAFDEGIHYFSAFQFLLYITSLGYEERSVLL